MEDVCKDCMHDFNWALGLNRFSLRLLGIWPDYQDANKKSINAVLRIPCMVLVMVCFVLIPQTYALVLVSNNYLLIIDNIMTNCCALACSIKLFILWNSEQVLRPVVMSTTVDWLQQKFEWERQIMRRNAAIAKSFTIGGYIFTACSYVGFVIGPLFGINIRLITNITDYAERHLLFQSYYPYDYSTSPNFELTYISQLFGGIFITMSVAIPDNYFGALVFHLSAQFRLLGLHIEHFMRVGNKTLGNQKILCRHLRVFVDRHVHLVKMASAVEKSFTLQILMQLFIMCVMACCLGFRILYGLQNLGDEKQSIFQFLNLIAGFISMMLFTLADCSASESLSHYRAMLHDNIYNSKWYLVTYEKSITSDLIIMMILSKNPQLLTAGKIFYLSMSTYCQILKSIAGYISVLIAATN